MRKVLIFAASALVAAVVAVAAASVITANTSGLAAAPASAPISVMQMMIDARNLPVEQFDAI